MNWKNHSNLEGCHAFLGASKFHWINHDETKVAETYNNYLTTLEGTELHRIAADCIAHKIKLQKSKNTLNTYVNDAIGFHMKPEQVLYYSTNCFGTADAISFRDNLLRIHDLKTGHVPAHIEQLMIYAALFCLEYGYSPRDINIELRIYQNNEVLYHIPEPDEILDIMDKIKKYDKVIDSLKQE